MPHGHLFISMPMAGSLSAQSLEDRMRKSILIVAVITLALFGFANFAQAQKEMNKDKEHGGQKMMAELSGAAEVPGPGDTDGSGMAHVTLNHGQGQVCYDISAKDIQAPTAAHLHAGPAGQAGDVKVTFKASADGMWKGCATADKALIKEIMDNPANFYVNVHNAEFPNGAIRGQLSK
jgi:CHRD domain